MCRNAPQHRLDVRHPNARMFSSLGNRRCSAIFGTRRRHVIQERFQSVVVALVAVMLIGNTAHLFLSGARIA